MKGLQTIFRTALCAQEDFDTIPAADKRASSEERGARIPLCFNILALAVVVGATKRLPDFGRSDWSGREGGRGVWASAWSASEVCSGAYGGDDSRDA